MFTSGGAVVSLCTTIPLMRGASAFAMQRFPYLDNNRNGQRNCLITTRTNRIFLRCRLTGVAGNNILFFME
jgi:hypothetical protein